MLSQITTSLVYTHLLVFCRLGMALLLLPGLGEAYMSPRARLFGALGLTLVIVPIAQPWLPPLPETMMGLVILIGKELVIGCFIGAVGRIVLSAVHTAGMVISYQSGLASASLFDPSQGEQSAAIGTFLTLIAIALIFATNLHHVFIGAIINSYTLFHPGGELPLGDFTEMVAKTVSSAFEIGVKMAIPQVIIGLILYLGAGVMGRLMPQMQVFFVLMPVQIVLGFGVLMMTLSFIFIWFMDYYQNVMGEFIAG